MNGKKHNGAQNWQPQHNAKNCNNVFAHLIPKTSSIVEHSRPPARARRSTSQCLLLSSLAGPTVKKLRPIACSLPVVVNPNPNNPTVDIQQQTTKQASTQNANISKTKANNPNPTVDIQQQITEQASNKGSDKKNQDLRDRREFLERRKADLLHRRERTAGMALNISSNTAPLATATNRAQPPTVRQRTGQAPADQLQGQVATTRLSLAAMQACRAHSATLYDTLKLHTDNPYWTAMKTGSTTFVQQCQTMRTEKQFSQDDIREELGVPVVTIFSHMLVYAQKDDRIAEATRADLAKMPSEWEKTSDVGEAPMIGSSEPLARHVVPIWSLSTAVRHDSCRACRASFSRSGSPGVTWTPHGVKKKTD